MKMRNTMVSLVSLMVVSGLLGCTDFEGFSREVCGNSVVETGEYCDGVGQEDGVCIAAMEPGACHYKCDFMGGGDSALKCPSGQGCGVDGICRASAGSFEDPISFVGDRILGFGSGDFDGDGRTDLVSYSTSRTDIQFFDESGDAESQFSVPGFPDQPAISRLDEPVNGEPNTSDLMMKSGDAISVLLGQMDATLRPMNFSTNLTGFSDTIFRTVPLLSNITKSQRDVVFLYDAKGTGEGGTKLRLLELAGPPPMGMDGIDVDGGSVRGKVGKGFLNAGLPCETLAFMTDKGKGANAHVHIFLPCKEVINGMEKEYVKSTEMAGSIEIAEGRVPWRGVWIADVDHDAYPDILYGTSAEGGGDQRIEIARIDALSNLKPPFKLTGQAFLTVKVVTQEMIQDPAKRPEGLKCNFDPNAPFAPTDVIANAPLAFGDVDDDGTTEIIDALGILYRDKSDPAKPYIRVLCLDRDPWNAAAIGDFNAGFTDLVVASTEQRGIIFLNGAPGGLFTPHFIATNNYVREMISGDFDGDLITDFVVRQSDEVFSDLDVSGTQNYLSMLYGNVVGAPNEPVSLGSMTDIFSIDLGTVLGEDGASELVVGAGVAGKDSKNYMFYGRADRLFVAPLVLFPTGGQQGSKPSFPRQIISGQFAGSAAGDALVVTEEFSMMGRKVRFWMLKDIGSDQFSTEMGEDVTAIGGIAAEARMDYSFGLQLDKDGDSTTEAVVLGLDIDDKNKFWVARLTEDTSVEPSVTNISVSSTEPLESTLGSRFKTSDILQPFDSLVKIVDVNGDGLMDIAGVTEDNAVVVIWNTGDGGISTANHSKFGDGGRPILDIAFVNLDRDMDKELVLITNQEVFRADLVKDDTLANLVSADFVEAGKIIRNINAERAVGGDFNGDGVDDLVVGGAEGFSLLLGAKFVPEYKK